MYGSKATIPPSTLGYCFKDQEVLFFLIKIISPILYFSEIFFPLDRVHLISFKLNAPLTFSFLLSISNCISELLIPTISANSQFNVGSNLNFSIFFSSSYLLTY